MSDKDLFDKVAASIQADHPSFEVRYKDESLLMRLLGVLVFPFNESFSTDYTTTLGAKTYLPSRVEVAKDYAGYAGTLAHEGVHVFDDAKHPIWFKFSYALNQIAVLPLLIAYALLGSWIPVAALAGGVTASYMMFWLVRKLTSKAFVYKLVFFVLAGLSVLAYLGLAVYTSEWWAALAIGSFLPLVPVSSRWRAAWEFRGYSMTLAFDYWRSGRLEDSELAWIEEIFTGSDYYFMDPNAARVASNLKAIKASIIDGSLLVGADARPYQRTLDLLKQLGQAKAGMSA